MVSSYWGEYCDVEEGFGDGISDPNGLVLVVRIRFMVLTALSARPLLFERCEISAKNVTYDFRVGFFVISYLSPAGESIGIYKIRHPRHVEQIADNLLKRVVWHGCILQRLFPLSWWCLVATVTVISTAYFWGWEVFRWRIWGCQWRKIIPHRLKLVYVRR